MEVKNYADIRSELKPGDLIAHGGSTALDVAIKCVTGCNVSKLGCIGLGAEVTTGIFSLTGDTVKLYHTFCPTASSDNIWVLPIASRLRSCLCEPEMLDVLYKYEHIEYLPKGPEITNIQELIVQPNALMAPLYMCEVYTRAILTGFKKYLENNICACLSAIVQRTKIPMPADVISYSIFAEAYQIMGEETELFR